MGEETDLTVNVIRQLKRLARVHHVVVLKTKVLHFKIENTPIKDTNGKRKFNGMLNFLFVDKRKLFAMKLSFEEFNHGSLACFEPTKAARILKKLEVHCVLYGQGKYVFKREFLYL